MTEIFSNKNDTLYHTAERNRAWEREGEKCFLCKTIVDISSLMRCAEAISSFTNHWVRKICSAFLSRHHWIITRWVKYVSFMTRWWQGNYMWDDYQTSASNFLKNFSTEGINEIYEASFHLQGILKTFQIELVSCRQWLTQFSVTYKVRALLRSKWASRDKKLKSCY